MPMPSYLTFRQDQDWSHHTLKPDRLSEQTYRERVLGFVEERVSTNS